MSNDRVFVGCKLPSGIIIHLDTPNGKTARWRLNGFRNAPEGQTCEGYGITRGVPREFFNAWRQKNADLSLIKNGVIFAVSDIKDFQAIAREMRRETSGLEPIEKTKLAERAGVSKKAIAVENYDGITDEEKRAADEFIHVGMQAPVSG